MDFNTKFEPADGIAENKSKSPGLYDHSQSDITRGGTDNLQKTSSTSSTDDFEHVEHDPFATQNLIGDSVLAGSEFQHDVKEKVASGIDKTSNLMDDFLGDFKTNVKQVDNEFKQFESTLKDTAKSAIDEFDMFSHKAKTEATKSFMDAERYDNSPKHNVPSSKPGQVSTSLLDEIADDYLNPYKMSAKFSTEAPIENIGSSSDFSIDPFVTPLPAAPAAADMQKNESKISKLPATDDHPLDIKPGLEPIKPIIPDVSAKKVVSSPPPVQPELPPVPIAPKVVEKSAEKIETAEKSKVQSDDQTQKNVSRKKEEMIAAEEMFCRIGLDAWFKPERLHPTVESLIYWRDTKKSGIVFGAGLAILLAMSCFSVISVFAYASLALLVGTVSFRIYKNVLQAVQKTSDGHPFKDYLELELALPQDKVQQAVNVGVTHINSVLAELRRLFLVEDLVDSIKFALLLWCLTYVGSWFNGMTLVILSFVALFTLPKVYENNKQSIDTYLDLVRSKFLEITEKVKAAIPIGKKTESEKDK